MKKIALTGGIATGKSTVIWMFSDMGAKIINVDDIAHELLEPKTAVWKLLFERYGDRIMQSGSKIDRPALGNIIFSDESERKYVEHIMHPRIHEIITKKVAELSKENIPYVIIEVPLLFESGWENEFDTTIVIRCDSEQQVVRCMEKFNLTRTEAEDRIKIQRPLDSKIEKADFVIDTAGSQSETLVQTQRLFRMFEKGNYS